MGLEIFTAVIMSVLVFRVVTPCELVGRYISEEYTASVFRAEGLNINCSRKKLLQEIWRFCYCYPKNVEGKQGQNRIHIVYSGRESKRYCSE
jgi:hypothetical protein